MPITVITHGQLWDSKYDDTSYTFICTRCGCYFVATGGSCTNTDKGVSCTCPECSNMVNYIPSKNSERK